MAIGEMARWLRNTLVSVKLALKYDAHRVDRLQRMWSILTTSWSDISSSSIEMIGGCCWCIMAVFWHEPQLVLRGDASGEAASPPPHCT
jgi:hypothetical protein